MDFSSLVSSGSLLYIIGGGVCVVLVIVLIFITMSKGGTSATSSPLSDTNGATPATTVESQSLASNEQILPSNEVLDPLPVAVNTNATTPAMDVSKGEIPPLSSWKPSQDAAPIPAEDTSSASAPLSETATVTTP